MADDIIGILQRGPPLELDGKPLEAFFDALVNSKTEGVNDRLLLLERVLVMMSRMEKKTPLLQKVQDTVIQLLYGDLPHPAATHLGSQYAYRMVDGSTNNVNLPSLGRAGTAYARSVQSTNPIPFSCLPDPGLISKKSKATPHPSGISSLLFAFANLIVHSLSKTDPKDRTIDNTSSYLDLSPLYGDSEEEQMRVRQVDGRGLLKTDTFSDRRLLLMPPSTPALMVLLSRNHNYIATKILQINERRSYKDPVTLAADPKSLKKQDDDIFNKARFVNCGHFMNIILSDWLGAILGITKNGSDWTLDPLESIRDAGHSSAKRGEGM
ncbi:hypothetical protein FRC02_005520 [Tulasnella sp. 418]|nr:hypothetical protein FRC02_005520 [Tulasnella sp. 418]